MYSTAKRQPQQLMCKKLAGKFEKFKAYLHKEEIPSNQ